MSVELLLWNTARYIAQTLLLIAVVEAATRGVRLRAPKARLAILHAVLIGCALLPFQQIRRPMINGRESNGTVTVQTGAASVVGASGPVLSVRSALIGIALGGAALRLLWLAVGLLRLQSRKRNARALMPVPEVIEDAERLVGVRSEYFVDPALSSPVAFGRSVLLPEKFGELALSEQSAVITHELLHVKRRDWIALLAEETVRGAVVEPGRVVVAEPDPTGARADG